MDCTVTVKRVPSAQYRASTYFVLARCAGVLAGVCRHEFPVKCINLFTEENFAYYEQLLAVVIREYGVCSPVEEAGLKWFIVDIGCKLKDYWQR